MNRKFFTALLGVALFMGAPLLAAVMEYTGSDGVTPVKVKAATPLPITGTIGSITASLSGDVRITSSTATLPVSGTVTAIPTGTQTITGSVIASIPEQISATVTGTVVATIPETISVTGSVVATIPETVAVSLDTPASWTQGTMTASTSVQTLTTDAKCISMMLQQLGSTTVWFTLDGTDPIAGAHGIQLTATGTALCQQSFPVGGSAPIKYVASVATLFEQVQSLKP